MTTTHTSTRPRFRAALFPFSLVACFGLLFTSCKKEVDVVTPKPPVEVPTNPQTPVGAVTPVATPEGTAITATIGPAGGTLESADKRLRVTIPAGALSSNQTISVQPLTQNHCPLGTGKSFRLTPHGLTFSKPATISFHYDDKDVNGSAPQLLRVAFQNDKGSWQSPATRGIDTTARLVTVQTTHFSDWGLFHRMEVSPDHAFVSPGEEVKLKVLEVPINPYEKEDDQLVPIPYYVPSKYIERWVLYGDGVLVHRLNEGTYFAPKQIPADNPETITVFLNQSTTIDGQVFKDLRLVSNIFVAPEGISFQVSKDDWKTFPGGANVGSGNNLIAGKIGEEHVQVIWTGTPTGTYSWTAGPSVSFLYVNGLFHRSHMYFKEVSGGSLRVNNDHPDWVVGTFTLTRAGWYDVAPVPPAHGTSSIKGVFRVKRL
ncbi:VCBS [Fibrisoma limi BUZ 3]|uniref:VCBS n=1 Tax=Fibrisoma limi BUZ 3 TaxID=1185876 RepID=I2GLE9_9BACT|nr:hypothetical protein [Fibrisoma limi]CCH54725.1 VCBS [Fibrisoma limi BUZ 3]